jgi:nucleoside-diphosphate-sugar epimerase
MAPIDPGSFVLVTGGNGFIAAHCIASLLRSNYRVRATVRSFEKGEATRKSLSSAGVGNLSLLEIAVVPDPTDPKAFAATLQGCQAILHLASAFNYDAVPGEFEEKLMIPAVKGTQVVCEAARLYPNIRRVVIMSSFASVYDAGLGLQPGRVYTEKDWCPLTYEDGVTASIVVSTRLKLYYSMISDQVQPIAYRASKVVAERAAWDYIRDNPVQYQLMTLCPGMVFGRMIHPVSSLSQLNASNQIIWQVLSAGKNAEVPPTKAPGMSFSPN